MQGVFGFILAVNCAYFRFLKIAKFIEREKNNKKGTYIDGLQISDITIKDLNLTDRSTVRFKMAVNEDADHVGGLTIYGKNFGNYNQDINIRINYSPLE